MAQIIDTHSNVPKYIQISDWIRMMIHKNRFHVGDKLPSELKLVEMCGVNRNTVRQAISELVKEGFLYKKNGVGTFIHHRRPKSINYSLDHISSTLEDLRYAGYRPSTILVSKKIIDASEEISERLMLGSGSKIIQITRLRMADRTPLIIEKSHIPFEEFKAILDMDLTGSLYQLMTEQFRVRLHSAIQNFRAVLLSGLEARLLMLPEKSAGLFLESVIYDAHNVAVEVLHAHYRGDKYVFQVHSGSYKVNLQST